MSEKKKINFVTASFLALVAAAMFLAGIVGWVLERREERFYRCVGAGEAVAVCYSESY
jgi:hypothetical protein